MPCDSTCLTSDSSFIDPQLWLPNISPLGPDPVQMYANMGWVGYVILNLPKLGNARNILRVTTADVNLSQSVEAVDVIDGRIDKSVYKLGPKQVEGSFSMPIVADLTESQMNQAGASCRSENDVTYLRDTAGTLLNNIWCWTVQRGPQGRLVYDDAYMDVRYANHAAFRFDRVLVNSLSMSAAQSEHLTFDINIIGRARIPAADVSVWPDIGAGGNPGPEIIPFLSPARVLTWNDISVNGVQGCSNSFIPLFYSNQVRDFSFEIANNADRFYTLNGSLFPVDINVSKREITGSMTLMGLQEALRKRADTNAERFTSKDEIRMAFYVGNETYNPSTGLFNSRDWTGSNTPTDSIFAKKFVGVIFNIETMTLSNDLYETSIEWRALADDEENYEAIAGSAGGETPGSPSCYFPAWA